MNIVVIQSDDGLRRAFTRSLSDVGYRVSAFGCAEDFIEATRPINPDMLLVDVNLPGESGLSLTARMRRLQPRIGIILLSERDRPSDRRDGYEMGADIYLTTPVAADELTAVVGALRRRVAAPAASVPDFRVDLNTRQLHGPERSLPLTASELAVLVALARAPERRFEAWQIGAVLGGDESIASRNTINVTIFRINQKIKEAGAGERGIRAIRNWGYELTIPFGIDG
ncbi:response regulator transcription factor [Aquibium microcysteis]|uniref:response regulator transcription factor n=1 Tax=Aquibium microcysteis TaxID=675281 RepID=UPI00165D2F89|nr:response regulator transcription factor [Aquibium microcysteis]